MTAVSDLARLLCRRSVLVALPAVLLVPATAAQATGGIRVDPARQATCRGEAATVVTDEFWSGTAERDVVVASAATVDEVWGGLGDDLICVYGEPGAPYHGLSVSGGPGNDTVLTYGGSNEIYGDDDDDIVYLNGTGEYVEGGDGDDHVWGLGADGLTASGGAGTDVLQGSPGDDTLAGGSTGDLLIGAGGADNLDGDDGDDTLIGGAGSAELDGGAGQDSCQDAPPATFAGCESITGSPGIGVTG
jgi:Ca2+-binding RTX toxin-like protein